jgi:hypothetical protein
VKYAYIILVSVLLSGCANMPGAISTNKSEFDGTTTTTMAWSYPRGISHLGIGLTQSSLDPNIIYFDAVVLDLVGLIAKEGLLFNIDGKVISLSSSSATTDFSSQVISGSAYRRSERSYVGSLSLLKKICSAESVKVKLLTNDGYDEAVISGGDSTNTIKAMRKYLATISI